MRPMRASQFFKRSPMFDSVEIIRAVERQCARCEMIDGHKPGCIEPRLQLEQQLTRSIEAERARGKESR